MTKHPRPEPTVVLKAVNWPPPTDDPRLIEFVTAMARSQALEDNEAAKAEGMSRPEAVRKMIEGA